MDARTRQPAVKTSAAASLPIPRSLRRAVLPLLLVVVAAIGFILRGDDLRTWWLSRQSVSELRTRTQSSPHDPLVWYIYGQKLLRDNQADAAGLAFQQAAQSLPYGASDSVAEKINANCGYLLARQGQAQDATKYLDFAHKLNDEDPLVAVGYGILFAQQKKYAYAATQFRLATAVDPHNAEAWFRLGSALNADSKFAGADDALRHALAIAPNDAASHAELAHALASRDQSAEALNEYRRAHDLAPDNEGYAALLGTTLAQSAHTQADYQDAARLMDMAFKRHPDDASLANVLGALHTRFNAPNLALPYLQRSVELSPHEAEGWYNLARAQQMLGHTSDAAQAQKRFQFLQRLVSEISVASKHIAVAPNDPVWRIRVAKLYAQEGNLEAARAQYSIALSLQSDNVEARQAVSDLRRRLREQKTPAGGPAAASLGPPPPPGLQIYDPDHELPAFQPQAAAPATEAGKPPPANSK